MVLDGEYRALVRPVALALAGGMAFTPAEACDLALVLAVDVSLSVNSEEFVMQRDGTARALLDPGVKAALLANGSVMLSFMQWSGRNEHSVSVPWTRIGNTTALQDFSAELGRVSRGFWSETAPGSAIARASDLHRRAPVDCARKVIDISGDGIENTGLRTRTASERAVADGITINGLVILGDDDRVEPFYRHNVIGGEGAFMERANGFADYPRAIRDKLLKELPPLLTEMRLP